jgi:dihydrofolate reductase
MPPTYQGGNFGVIISLIVAMDERRGIGKENRLPWHLSSDLKRFKRLTMGHHIVMGRKTYETIGRLLPGRIMIIVTRRTGFLPEGCKIANSLTTAIEMAEANNESELFIIGGGEIFNHAITKANILYLTTIHTDVNADVFFPKFDLQEWKIDKHETIPKSEGDDYPSDFTIFRRVH